VAEAKARTSRRRPASSRRDEVVVEEVTGEGSRPACSFAFCPICMAFTAVGDAKPELVDHLLMAGREMLLAVRALIDARLEGTAGKQATKLERLTIE
jgi:hypothetical protein